MYESQRLSETSIYDILEGSQGTPTTIYSHDRDTFYRYTLNYQLSSLKFSYEKYILTTVELIDKDVILCKRPIRRSNCLSFQDVMDFSKMFDDIFKEELIYLSFSDMIKFVIDRIRLGQINMSNKGVQELVDLYPESFI